MNYIENEGVNILTSPCIRNFLNAFSHMPPEFHDRYSLSLGSDFPFSETWQKLACGHRCISGHHVSPSKQNNICKPEQPNDFCDVKYL